ncbi:glycosyltransferase family 2 protein [Shewanella benthica]|uniref:Putative LPS biosynthesis related glycosyltransferase n=1 Tax=Shewanella benthica KT99 TaxID=314608 RepID=A9D4J0_9GAMM|nr:glycosyltransferase family 2 protein [Shewanella benthica]EDQ01565.1 putative LPS biosynthesis related glycosyltransferase [Shewanella benthica KT99]
MQTNPLISIVTVCYNVASELPETIESIINQDYNNIEYIIIDGGSSDNSVEIIKHYEQVAKQKGVYFKWISEPDNGIYDAMNKGIELATGQWVNFMNVGDLPSSGYLSTMESLTDISSEVNIVYGNTRILQFNKLVIPPKHLKKQSFYYQMPLCHQSIFYKVSSIKKYNPKFSIIADEVGIYEELINNGSNSFLYLPFEVCTYSLGGVSEEQIYTMYKQQQLFLVNIVGLTSVIGLLIYKYLVLKRKLYLWLVK